MKNYPFAVQKDKRDFIRFNTCVYQKRVLDKVVETLSVDRGIADIRKVPGNYYVQPVLDEGETQFDFLEKVFCLYRKYM